jgi:hypothetical protein
MNRTKMKKLIRKHLKQRQREMAVTLEGLVPVPWEEDKTPIQQLLYLDAKTCESEPLFDIRHASPSNVGANYLVSPMGSLAYQNRRLPRLIPLRLGSDGQVCFSGDIALPTLVDLATSRSGFRFSPSVKESDRVRNGFVWMSTTPNEMISQRSGVQAANGTVVIGGLGLGWLLRKVCEKETVDRVIVVEWSQELLDWYGTDLCGKYPKVTDVICDDVYNQIGKHGDDAVHLLDIWPVEEGANDDHRFRASKRELGDRIWGWGWTGAPDVSINRRTKASCTDISQFLSA